MSALPTDPSTRENRPTSVAEKESFSSGGRPHLLVLHGKWGLAVDEAIVWTTGWSLMTAQYAWDRVDRRARRVHAHVAQGSEWESLYAELCRQSVSTKAYQTMCSPRQLPLVILREWARIAS